MCAATAKLFCLAVFSNRPKTTQFTQNFSPVRYTIFTFDVIFSMQTAYFVTWRLLMMLILNHIYRIEMRIVAGNVERRRFDWFLMCYYKFHVICESIQRLSWRIFRKFSSTNDIRREFIMHVISMVFGYLYWCYVTNIAQFAFEHWEKFFCSDRFI